MVVTYLQTTLELDYLKKTHISLPELHYCLVADIRLTYVLEFLRFSFSAGLHLSTSTSFQVCNQSV